MFPPITESVYDLLNVIIGSSVYRALECCMSGSLVNTELARMW
jgi:hypothetical protein